MLPTALRTCSCLLAPLSPGQTPGWDYSRHQLQGLFPELLIRVPTWASYLSGIPAWLLITSLGCAPPPLLGALRGVRGIPNFPEGRAFKQVELALFYQVPKHLTGHVLLKKPFLITSQKAGLGCPGRWGPLCEVTPDLSGSRTSARLGWGCWGSSLGQGSQGCREDPLGAAPGWAAGGRRPLWEARQWPCVVHSPPPTQEGQLRGAQRQHCEAGPSSQWGWHGAGPKEWLLGAEWQWGEVVSLAGTTGRAQVAEQARSSLSSLHVCPAETGRGLWVTRLLPSLVWQDPALLGEEGPALHLGSSREVPQGWAGSRAHAPATHTLTSSSSSASANSKVFPCTVLGTGALLPAWGAHSSSRVSQEARAWGSTLASSR